MGFFVLIFTQSWANNGTPTNATSVTIGVHDDTVNLQAVPAGTVMTNASAGEYSYSFATALPEHQYTATIIVTAGGRTYTFTEVRPAKRLHGSEEGHHHHGHDLGAAIAENAGGAASVSSAAGSVSAHSLQDQIAADQYLASRRAVNQGSALNALRPARMIPPSSIGARIGRGP